MVAEVGIVEKILPHKAVVRVQRSSACAHCSSRGACRVTEGKAMLIEVDNDLRAKVSDHVEISVPEGSLLKLSMLVYFMPILGLIAGALVGAASANYFNVQPTLASIVCGASAMGITFYGLKWLDRRAQAKGEYQPRMTRILFSADAPPTRR
jgi:sigma-E factor negative regulatory protein RseC